jgi:hypothetical protein
MKLTTKQMKLKYESLQTNLLSDLQLSPKLRLLIFQSYGTVSNDVSVNNIFFSLKSFLAIMVAPV